ncbi:vacuolar protein sorting-associated protein 16 homolog [Dendroctonus ponderosae]|uniref:vacuolar protein sorting-associated protein 16 homolog n=1 Tax=Dendroctonus ponderosae TaxID=77166 RepID=UPI0020356091|nr:vacuolar protein sorting-associated protein 16 homolog [Dendroctonus ponderosae]
MSSALITANWFLLGRDLYFRRLEIYSMEWNQEIKLENFIVSSASYGGPLALRRDDRKITKVRGPGQPVISIFSGSGMTVTSFKWTQRPIVHMGWSNEEKLICIQDDGNVVVFNMFGKLFHKFNIFPKVHDAKIVDAKVFTNTKNVTGIAVMTSNFNIFIVNSIKDIKTRQLSDVPKSTVEPTCWEVVSEEFSTDVFFARGKELYRLKQDEHHTSAMLQPDISNPYSAILEMAVSLNARHLCFFTDSGHLWLGSTDLRHKYCEIETYTIHRPKQLVWCGNETVVVYWEQDHTVLIVAKNGQFVQDTYDHAVHLLAEIDGVRIISSARHELLQKVPEVVQKIFRINSTEPGSFLLEASKQFQKGSHKANEYITLIKSKSSLEDAVNQCLDAVKYEFDTDIQKMLIRAAQFGKCFISGMNSHKYVKMCCLLRVLNAIRHFKVGISLTIEQLKYMKLRESPSADENEALKNLLDRLIVRNMYYLALQIAKCLKLPESVGSSYIMVHWAKYKVGQHQADEEIVAREIASKLGYSSGVSYREIAEKASEFGKNKLAIKLLEYESKASEQVELLLKLHENKSALHNAIESGDTDLIYMVVLKLREKMPLGDFKMTIRNFPVAQALYIKYCKEYYKSALAEIYIQEDDFPSQAQMIIEESLSDKNSHLRDSQLTVAIEAYNKGRKDLYASMCEETLKLSKFQRELEEKFQSENKFVGKSVHDTCKILLEMKDVKLAEKVKNDFKIPDKRYWFLRINTLAALKEWIELDKFAKLKKSPVGYGPFVDACWANHNKDEALKYMQKVPDDLKAKYYLKIECYSEAAEIAFQQRDIQSLLSVQCRLAKKNPELLLKVTGMLNQLDYKN